MADQIYVTVGLPQKEVSCPKNQFDLASDSFCDPLGVIEDVIKESSPTFHACHITNRHTFDGGRTESVASGCDRTLRRVCYLKHHEIANVTLSCRGNAVGQTDPD